MGGATEFVCNDSHGTMNNVDPEQLHGRAVYVAGRHKPLYTMEDMDDSVDVVFFAGTTGLFRARVRCCHTRTTRPSSPGCR
jgi:D-amino peptidase